MSVQPSDAKAVRQTKANVASADKSREFLAAAGALRFITPASSRKRSMRSVGSAPLASHALTLSRSRLSRRRCRGRGLGSGGSGRPREPELARAVAFWSWSARPRQSARGSADAGPCVCVAQIGAPHPLRDGAAC